MGSECTAEAREASVDTLCSRFPSCGLLLVVAAASEERFGAALNQPAGDGRGQPCGPPSSE